MLIFLFLLLFFPLGLLIFAASFWFMMTLGGVIISCLVAIGLLSVFFVFLPLIFYGLVAALLIAWLIKRLLVNKSSVDSN